MIIIIGELSGSCLIYFGIKRIVNGSYKFKIRNIFQNIPLDRQSGVQLVIEGVGVILSGLLLFFAFFKWK